ncbi:branched-chain amino acid ABC transporter permease [Diaminobutyricimonas sp. LJ205]|uniref:branched-chain amino acid ABC transporter permease n=1 Tax=Diaminobutyricimonas sp. LJ205 TaxID=2683590 RepID=UPI001E455474|nr:branched-chain amino acid ABC transporter permease [Diaminobutyricimonas sp. LJ205]
MISTLISGVAYGVPLFLVASGLTLIYGVIGVLNFAHGSFFVIGALLATTIIGSSLPTVVTFIIAVLAGAAAVAALGIVTESTVVRRLYRRDHITMLLATFAILLIVEGAAEMIWGNSPRSISKPEIVSGSVRLLGATIPVYDILLVVIGALVAVGLFVLINKSSFGRSVRAVAQDAAMGEAVGLNTKRIMLLVFGLGSALAGLAGALIAPNVSVSPSLGHAFMLQSFAIVIIGGLGSVTGSLVAALLVGVAEAFAVAYAPYLTGFTFYILVAVVLLVRPRGLLGSAKLGRA